MSTKILLPTRTQLKQPSKKLGCFNCVRVGRIGHESISLLFVFRFATDSKSLSVLDPGSSVFLLFATKNITVPFDSPRKVRRDFSPPAQNKKRLDFIKKSRRFLFCAGGENRTPVLCLEGRYSTTKLHPQKQRFCHATILRASVFLFKYPFARHYSSQKYNQNLKYST